MTQDELNARLEALMGKQVELFPTNDVPAIHLFLWRQESGELKWEVTSNLEGGTKAIVDFMCRFLEMTVAVPSSAQAVRTLEIPGKPS